MSFTLTSQSVMRFESSSTRLGDEWRRTLMFFNVDISGGVHCDHRNEITASRPQDRNGKRRNPGGGLTNPIIECAMPFGQTNEFYAQSRDEFEHRGCRSRCRCSHPCRRINSSYCENRRHLQYRSAKPRWNNSDMAPFSHYPTQHCTNLYVTPDYETDIGYDNEYKKRCTHKSYPIDEYELPNQISRDLSYTEEAPDCRDCYDTESFTDLSYESPHDYHTNERPTQGAYRRSYEPLPYRNFTPYYTDGLSCNESLSQNNIFWPRGKMRQTSGSMLPDYALDYNHKDKYHKDYKHDCRYDTFKDLSESDYEDAQPPPELGNKVRYSPKKHFNYEDYGEKRCRPSTLLSPKPKAKYRSDSRPAYKTYKDKGFFRSYKTETERCKNADFSDRLSRQSHEPGSRHKNRSKESGSRNRNRSKESGSGHRNRTWRHANMEKISPYFSHFKKSAHNNRISKQASNFVPPTMHKKNPKDNESVPRSAPEKRKLDLFQEEIPQPFKKTIKKEVPCSNFLSVLSIHEEIPRRHRNLVRESSVNFGNTSSSNLYDHFDRKTNLKPSLDKKNLFDFGTEIPYRLWKSAVPSMLFKLDIPLTKMERPMCSHLKDSKSDSSCDIAVPHSRSAAKLKKESLKTTFRPRVSLYEVENNRPAKSIKQKISGFLKMSKKNQKKCNTFKDKIKKMKTIRQDDQDNEKSCSRSNSQKSRASGPSTSQRSKTTSTYGPKECFSANPSMTNKTKRCLSKIGTGCHYPTVFRGNCRNDENEEFSSYNFMYAMRCSKCDQFDRISSGNCSLNNDGKRNESICDSEKTSQKTASLILTSKENCSHASNNAWSETGSVSSNISISLKSNIKKTEFRNLRISPPPSIGQRSSTTSSSSQNSSIREIVPSKPSQDKLKSIKSCINPPKNNNKSTSSDVRCPCPRHRICANWSLTQKSCCSHIPNHHALDCISCRPSRPGLCVPENIEMSSRPPNLGQCELNMRSSLKRSNNPKDRISNKKVCLKINSSSSCLSKISSAKGSSNDSRQSKKSIIINDKSSSCSGESIIISDKHPCCSLNIGNMGNGQQIQSQPIPRSVGKYPCSSTKSYNIGEISSCCIHKRGTGNLGKTECDKCPFPCSEERKTISKPKYSKGSIIINVQSACNCAKNSNIGELGSFCNTKTEFDNIEKAECNKFPSITCNLGEERQIESQSLSCSCEKCPCSSAKTYNIGEIHSSCNAKTKIGNIEKPECHKFSCISGNMGEERQLESQSISCSCEKCPCSSENIYNIGETCYCCNAKTEIDKMEKPECHKCPCMINNIAEERHIKLQPTSCSCGKCPCSSTKTYNICETSPSCNAKKEVCNMEKPECNQCPCIIGNMGEEQKIELQSTFCSCGKCPCNAKKEVCNMEKPECHKCPCITDNIREERHITLQSTSCSCGKCPCSFTKTYNTGETSPSCNAKKDVCNTEKPECHKCPCIMDNMDEKRHIELQSTSCSCGKCPCSSTRTYNIGETSPSCNAKKEVCNMEKPECHKCPCITDNIREERHIELQSTSCSCGKCPCCSTRTYNIGETSPSCNTKKEVCNMEKPECNQCPCIIGNMSEERQVELQSTSCSCGNCPCSSAKAYTIGETISCCNAKTETDNAENPECHKCPCMNDNIGDERGRKIIPKACSWPGEKPSTYCRRPTVSYYIPKDPHQGPDSTASECSRHLSQTHSMCSRESMQLICTKNSSCPCCSMNLNNGNTQSLSHPPCDESLVPIPAETMMGWTESTGGKGIVENLKRELMNTFRKNRNLGSPCSGLRHTPHLMFFPFRPSSIITANRFYSPDSVVCWAACSRPPAPF